MRPATTLADMVETDGRRVVVIDDDPTGGQAAAGVDVLLSTDPAPTREWFEGTSRALYVVANTRSMAVEKATASLREYRDFLRSTARQRGEDLAIVLRGDSTLRGHILPEADVFGAREERLLFVPAFPEGGRVTIDGTHYLTTGQQERRPVDATEFAKDPVFAFPDSFFPRFFDRLDPARPVVLVSLDDLRSNGPAAVVTALTTAPVSAVVVPDAETVDDIVLITQGLLLTEASGVAVTVRSAATLAALRAGVYAWSLAGRPAPSVARTLVVCGSHTEASTRQLARLGATVGDATVELSTIAVMSPPAEAEVDRCAEAILRLFRTVPTVVLQTERTRAADHSTLAHGSRVMDALSRVVQRVRDQVDRAVVKGGISSADIARFGFGALRGRIVGRLEPGISLWALDCGRADALPYVVVPGNVGDDAALLRCVRWLSGTPEPV